MLDDRFAVQWFRALTRADVRSGDFDCVELAELTSFIRFKRDHWDGARHRVTALHLPRAFAVADARADLSRHPLWEDITRAYAEKPRRTTREQGAALCLHGRLLHAVEASAVRWLEELFVCMFSRPVPREVVSFACALHFSSMALTATQASEHVRASCERMSASLERLIDITVCLPVPEKRDIITWGDCEKLWGI